MSRPGPNEADDLTQELSIDQAVYAKSGVVSMPVSRRVRSSLNNPAKDSFKDD